MTSRRKPIAPCPRRSIPAIFAAAIGGLVQCTHADGGATESETSAETDTTEPDQTPSPGDIDTNSNSDAGAQTDLTNLHLAVPYLQACINANRGFDDVKDAPELVLRGTVSDYGLGLAPYHCIEQGSVGRIGTDPSEGLGWLTISDADEPGKEWVVGMHPAGLELNFASLLNSQVELRFHQTFRDQTRLAGIALLDQDSNYLFGFEDVATPEDWMLPKGMHARLGPAIQEFESWCSLLRGYDLEVEVDGRISRHRWATTEDYRDYRLTHGGITAPHGPLEDCTDHHPHSATMIMYKRAFLSGESATP